MGSGEFSVGLSLLYGGGDGDIFCQQSSEVRLSSRHYRPCQSSLLDAPNYKAIDKSAVIFGELEVNGITRKSMTRKVKTLRGGQ